MNKLLTALILTATALTAQAEEKKTINMPFGECTTQARELAKKGTNLKEIELIRSAGLMMFFFQTKTDHYTIACAIIGNGGVNDYMSITKQSSAEYAEANRKAEQEKQSKASAIAKDIGL
jgi:hypothetical protein